VRIPPRNRKKTAVGTLNAIDSALEFVLDRRNSYEPNRDLAE
jgi:hypothetical protein